MIFKMMLWSTLVFFEHGSELQLAAALVVNSIQMSAHIHFKPFGGDEAALMNFLQFCTLALTFMINFGGLALNYLNLGSLAFPDKRPLYDAQMHAIQRSLEVFAILAFLAFIGIALKKMATFCVEKVPKIKERLQEKIGHIYIKADENESAEKGVLMMSNPVGIVVDKSIKK